MIVRAACFTLLLVSCAYAFGSDPNSPNIYFADIPDMSQISATDDLPGDGAMYCAPVAVSNSLVWLESNDDEDYQLGVMRKLGSLEYMGTRPRAGPGVGGVLHGLKKYVKEVHGGYQRLEYAGWRYVPEKYRQSSIPSLKWMLSGLTERGAVWLNIGWYFENDGGYQRKGGHWVTLVGYRDGKLIIHDPGPWADGAGNSQFVRINELTNGMLQGKYRGLPTEAQGYLKLDQAMPTAYSGSIAIIDGAVLLALHYSSQNTTILQ